MGTESENDDAIVGVDPVDVDDLRASSSNGKVLICKIICSWNETLNII